MTKRIISVFLLLTLAISTLSIFATCVSASSSCTIIQGTAKEEYSFVVETGSRWLFSEKITLKQSKGKISYNTMFKNNKTKQMYGRYTITIEEENGKTQTTTWKDATKTLRLKANRTYTITVRPFNRSEMQKSLGLKAFNNWVNYPVWRITNTKGINVCH